VCPAAAVTRLTQLDFPARVVEEMSEMHTPNFMERSPPDLCEPGVTAVWDDGLPLSPMSDETEA
jgi:hypothetical protein